MISFRPLAAAGAEGDEESGGLRWMLFILAARSE